MGIPIGQTTTISMSGVAFRGVICEHCEQRFGYPIGRSVAGQGFSFLFLDNEGASDRAADSAGTKLESKLKQDVEVYRCPKCGYFDPSMFRLIQSKFYIWIAACAVLAFLAGVAAIIVAIMQLGHRHDGLPAWSILSGIAGTLVCTILISIRVLLSGQINPNEEPYLSALLDKYPAGYEAEACRERIQMAESIYVAELRSEKNIISAGVIPHDGLKRAMALLTKPAEETKSTSGKRQNAHRREERSGQVADRRRNVQAGALPETQAPSAPAAKAKSQRRGNEKHPMQEDLDGPPQLLSEESVSSRVYCHEKCGTLTEVGGSDYYWICNPLRIVMGTVCVSCGEAYLEHVYWADTNETLSRYRSRLFWKTPFVVMFLHFVIAPILVMSLIYLLVPDNPNLQKIGRLTFAIPMGLLGWFFAFCFSPLAAVIPFLCRVQYSRYR